MKHDYCSVWQALLARPEDQSAVRRAREHLPELLDHVDECDQCAEASEAIDDPASISHIFEEKPTKIAKSYVKGMIAALFVFVVGLLTCGAFLFHERIADLCDEPDFRSFHRTLCWPG